MIWIALTMAHASPLDDVNVVLDGLHRAATEADAPAYFGAFTDDAVFIGTDPTERWELAAFRAFAAPHFEQAPAWEYRPAERHVSFDAKERTAWFDEALDHASYGRVRGSGVLVRQGRTWRVAQYVLSFAVPNEVAGLVVAANQGEAWLPTPYTADQIRLAMPVGLVTEWRAVDDAGVETRTTWRVVAATEGHATLEHTVVGSDAPPAESRSAWEEFRDHARFPAAHTTVTEASIDTPLGSQVCRRYVVSRGEEQHTYWFSPAIPGPPMRMTVEVGGKTVLTNELVARTEPE